MKNVTANQRTLNILNKAIANGFEFENDATIEDTLLSAEEFLIGEEIDVIQEECQIIQHNNCQHYSYGDGNGYFIESTGEVVNWSDSWHKSADTKVFFETVVDSDANVVKLYYLVGETEFNAPDGYFYDRSEKRHAKIVNGAELEEEN